MDALVTYTLTFRNFEGVAETVCGLVANWGVSKTALLNLLTVTSSVHPSIVTHTSLRLSMLDVLLLRTDKQPGYSGNIDSRASGNKTGRFGMSRRTLSCIIIVRRNTISSLCRSPRSAFRKLSCDTSAVHLSLGLHQPTLATTPSHFEP